MTASRARSAGGGPRRRWVMRVRDLLGTEHHIVAQVHPGSGTVGLSAAGGPTVVLEPGDGQRLRAMLGEAVTQVLIDRGAPAAEHREETAAGLRRLAEDVAGGRGPRRGEALPSMAAAAAPIVPMAVHDALCGVRTASPMRTTPPTARCRACGLGYLVESALNRGGQCLSRRAPKRPGADR